MRAPFSDTSLPSPWRWGAVLPPVTAFACGLFLAVWGAGLLGGLLQPALSGLFAAGPGGGPLAASAAGTAAPAAEQPAAATPPPDPFVASGLFTLEPAAGSGEGDGEEHAADGTDGGGSEPTLSDLTRRLPAELADVAARLAEKQKRLEVRGKELEVEQEVLTKLRDDLDAQIARLEGLKQEIAGLLEQVSAEEEARLNKLVSIYEAMKAKQAAAIFNRLELPVLLKVARRMRETKLAPILARMDPARARQITAELSAAPELPRLD